jgi:hypothetical protein
MSTRTLCKEKGIDEDCPSLIATQMYELYGFQKALSTVIHYIHDAKDYSQRFEWERVAKEITALNIVDEKQTQPKLD